MDTNEYNKDFEVLTYKVKITDHPNADKLEIAHINDYQVVCRKGDFKTGDIVAYIPVDSVLPYPLIEKMGLSGKLGGDRRHRVCVKKIRGVYSYGLIHKVYEDVGVDVREKLGILKYRDPEYNNIFVGRGDIPNYATYMPGRTLTLRIKNIKDKPNRFNEGEQVIITEKIHGRSLCVGMFGSVPIITDKRLSYRGLVLIDNENNKDNMKMIMGKQILPIVQNIQLETGELYIYFFGEMYGKDVQNTNYGLNNVDFRLFDIFIGKPDSGHYVSFDEMVYMVKGILKTVPVLYRGQYNKDIVQKLTNGRSLLHDDIREGVVIKLDDPESRERKILKSVSPEFQIRIHTSGSDWE